MYHGFPFTKCGCYTQTVREGTNVLHFETHREFLFQLVESVNNIRHEDEIIDIYTHNF